MPAFHSNSTTRYLRLRRGAALVEYSLLIAAIASVILLAVNIMGHELFRSFGELSNWDQLGKKNNPGIIEPATTVTPAQSATAGTSQELQQPYIFLSWESTTVFAMLAVMSVLLYAISIRRKLRKNQEFHSQENNTDARKAAEERRFAKRQHILQVLSDDLEALFHNKMEVCQLMTQPVNFILPGTRCDEAREMMKREHVHHYPVCDQKGHLLGIISDRDLLATEDATVGRIMSTNIYTVRSDCKVNPAVTMMMKHSISALPVVDDGKLVGMLTTTDLVMTLQCTLHLIEKSTVAQEQSQH
jgi:CBS domain-containing protein/Flp pilus assembly pilin Flp